jgi:hypothetical protein
MDEQRSDREPSGAELKRPPEEIKDLSPEDDESEQVKGGVFELKTNEKH